MAPPQAATGGSGLQIVFGGQHDLGSVGEPCEEFAAFHGKTHGIQFGRTRLFQKTLEGSLAHLLACLVASGVIAEFVPMPIWIAGCGALAATVIEVLPIALDDNLTVGIASASVMHVARLLGT